MRHLRIVAAAFVALTVGLSSGCGGGGHGNTVATSPIAFTSTALPATLSGQVVSIPLQFSGGFGGPYIITVLSGTMPPGTSVDNATTSIIGRPLESGTFLFTLQLTDSGGQPFATTIASFQWDVGVGPLVFVTDSVLPSLLFGAFTSVPLTVAGGTPPYSCVVVDDPARPPLLPADEQPPLGMAIPTGSTAFVGTPLSAKVGNAPYFITIEAHDQTSPPIRKLFSVAVLIPPLVITTNSLSSGVCGTNYTDRVDLVDGIGPFRNLISQALNDSTMCTGEPGSPLTPPPTGPGGVAVTAKGTAPCAYAAEADIGPNYGSFSLPTGSRLPEGLYMKEGTGDLVGNPRRRGVFSFAFYVHSTTLPADPTQNKWRGFTISMATPPPGFALNPVVTVGGAFTPPNNKIGDMELTVNYNPDGGPAGLQFLALGGIPQDGRWDAPHDSQGQFPLVAKPGETAGAFAWSNNVVTPPPAGMTFTAAGVMTGTPTQRQGYANFTVTASDSLLPTPLLSTAGGTVQYAVGPDSVVITESSSGSGTAGFLDPTYDNNSQTVEIYEQYSSGTAVVRYLSDGPITGNINSSPSDMAATQTNPSLSTSGNNGGRSFLYPTLTAIDFLRVGIIPTNRYHDVHGLSTQGPRAGQHCDRDSRFPQEAIGTNVWQKFTGQNTAPQEGGDFTSNSAIELPELSAAAITNMPTAPAPLTNGIYANGGLMYGFDNANCFGFFIVRKDSKFYLPCVFNKPGASSPFSTTGAIFNGFGDGWVTSTQTASSRLRMPCITVSPNGRFAAVKLKQTISNNVETADQSKICIFSLCGEKVFDNGAGVNTSTFKVINTGGSGGLSDGRMVYGDTLSLTDRHLYWLQGNYIGYDTATGQYGPNVIHCNHWVYRYEYTPNGGVSGNASGGLLNSGASFSTTTWTNSAAGGSIANYSYPGSTSALSTAYHRFSGPGTSSSYAYTTYQPNRGASGVYVGDGVTSPACTYFGYNWGNTFETSMAPTPFRVSVDGLACAIVAGPNNTFPTSATYANFRRFIYVDECTLAATSATYGATTNFRNTQSTVTAPVHTSSAGTSSGGTARRYGGAQRVGGLFCGEEINQNYGWFQGPATQLEIADDHSSLAAVYNDSHSGGASSPTLGAFANSSGASYWIQYRENIVCFVATGSSPNLWAATPTEVPVTGSLISGSGTNHFSATNSTIWRFGCLAYTRDNGAFVFWGGASGYFSNSASSSYLDPGQLTGTLYAYDIVAGTRKSILSVANGGNENGLATYGTGSPAPCNPTSMSSWGAPYFGVIEPTGAFYSNDGKFFYVVNYAALAHTATDGTSQRLVGVNVSARTSNTINGRIAMEGFQHSSFAGLFRGFGATGYIYPGFLTKGCIGNTGARGMSEQVSCAGTNGLTYFVTQYQNYNAGNAYKYITTGDLGGGPVYNRAWAYYDGYGGEVFGFDSSVGGEPFRLSTLGGSLNDTTYRKVTHIQANRSGSRVAMSVNTTTLTYWGHDGKTERPFMISPISTNAVTGALSSTPTMVALETSPGRLGPSMATDSTDQKFYYAFGSTSGTEAGMVLTEKSFSPAGAVIGTRTSNGYAGTPARFAVLWSGR